ncbi:MAG: hypothetical protein MZV70_40360 [Desulfobacterales bacterium]|nr:hypothetical protein [Desulfobacterales bacterium]
MVATMNRRVPEEKIKPFRLVKYFTFTGLVVIFLVTLILTILNTHWVKSMQRKKSRGLRPCPDREPEPPGVHPVHPADRHEVRQGSAAGTRTSSNAWTTWSAARCTVSRWKT